MLEDFIEKLSREMELEEPLKAQVPGIFVLPLDEGLNITITSTPSHSLAFSCTVGVCPNTGKEAFYTRLLLANLFGQGTKGAVLALDLEAGQVTLTQNFDYHLEYKDFRDAIEDFINAADLWKQEIDMAATL